MKLSYWILVVFFLVGSQLNAQDTNNEVGTLNDLVELLKQAGKSDKEIGAIIEGVLENPDLYNKTWNWVIEKLNNDEDKWGFLKDLNIDFKTFQAQEDSSLTSLGFAYDFSFDWSKFKESEKNRRTQHSFSINTKGNVAFNKEVNPTDFLESDVTYTLGQFQGGLISIDKDTLRFTRLNEVEDEIVKLTNPYGEEAEKLWEEFGKDLILSNQFYYGVNFSAGVESNQDFSDFQYKGGVHLGLGMKAWNEESTLSKLNIFDYPFALLRIITQTDKTFQPRGSTFPTALVGLDYIIPSEDSDREEIEGELNPFPRFKFEIGYRTLVSEISNTSIFFAANYRLYQELGASDELKEENLGKHSYLVLSLQSSKGFYVSYSTGKLPFDKKDDKVYELGFQYKF